MYSHVLVTPPTQEPLTISEIARQVRLDSLMVEPTPLAPTVALAGVGAGNVDNGQHRYRLTFVTADGETDGGAISSAVTVVDKTLNGKVALSAIPIGGGHVTARRVYRTAAAGSTYFLVATIADNTSTTYTDNTADASLGVGIPIGNTTASPELLSLQTAARQLLESRYSRAFLTQTWRATFDGFPYGSLAPLSGYGGPAYFGTPGYPIDPFTDPFSLPFSEADQIPLPMPVLQSITSITYIDPSGAQQTLSTSVYDVDTDSLPGRVILKYGQAWPATRTQRNAVVITLVAGYSDPSLVPERWKQAIKLLVSHWFENRELLGSIDDAWGRTLDNIMNLESAVVPA